MGRYITWLLLLLTTSCYFLQFVSNQVAVDLIGVNILFGESHPRKFVLFFNVQSISQLSSDTDTRTNGVCARANFKLFECRTLFAPTYHKTGVCLLVELLDQRIYIWRLCATTQWEIYWFHHDNHTTRTVKNYNGKWHFATSQCPTELWISI